MTPLRITAHLRGQISLPIRGLALDALLAATVARRLNLDPPATARDCVPIEIPIQREPDGRFHLCSHSIGDYDEHDIHWINRRAPVEQYQAIGSAKIKRVQITAGQNKSYRIPLQVGMVEGDTLTWFVIGDREQVEDLLLDVTSLGKKRSVGLGRVWRWEVADYESWGDGFPVVRDGAALRPLPADYPGLSDPPLTRGVLTYPYWDHTREEIVACP